MFSRLFGRQARTQALTAAERAKIECLRRRMEHLQKRIAASPYDLSYDRAEVSAIRWAVERLAGAGSTAT